MITFLVLTTIIFLITLLTFSIRSGYTRTHPRFYCPCKDLLLKHRKKPPPEEIRIAILGVCGSGKSSLARRLGALYNLKVIELDNIGWLPGWKLADDATFQEKLFSLIKSAEEQIARGELRGWVVDGNYKAGRSLIFPLVTTIIWLEYSLPLIVYQLTKRIFYRWYYRLEVCNGNIENVWEHFLTKESLYVWAWYGCSRKRKEYLPLFSEANSELDHVEVFHTVSPKETNQLVKSLKF